MCFKVAIEHQVEDMKFAQEHLKNSAFQHVSTLGSWIDLA